MFDNIPFDIQADIIKNLPIKSLIRFRLVSKQWKSLIHSSKFIIAEYNTIKNINMIVKFTCNQHSNKRDPVFDVFTLSTNAWRRLSKNLPRECIFITPYHVSIGRFMYWIAYCQWNIKNLIVSFDMTSEEFTEISLPESVAAGKRNNLDLYNIRESLFVAQFKIEAGKRVHSVWKMMEHGASKSFTKLYTIDVIKLVHGFRKSGEPIVEKKNDGRKDFFAYDPDSKHINFIGISREGYPYISVISYIETLLLLDH